MRSRGVLIIMAKAPRIGAVKRRLAKDIGPLNALQFYRRTLWTVSRRLSQHETWGTVLQVSPDRAATDGTRWPLPRPHLPQGHGGLGSRMARGLRSQKRGVPVVLIGSDIPGVTKAHIADAFRLLGSHDLVFGPAEDGGYWLVGVSGRRPIFRLFHNVRWSTPHALADTLTGLSTYKIAKAATLSDVDDAQALKRLKPL